MDVDGAGVMVTTYSVPIRDGSDSIKAFIVFRARRNLKRLRRASTSCDRIWTR